jgi:hypothetical protein
MMIDGTSSRRSAGLLAALVGTLAMAAAVFASSANATNLAEYDFESVSASISTSQAGGHPDLTTFVSIKTDPSTFADGDGDHEPWATTRDLIIDLPPGFTGNPHAVATCTILQFQSALEGGGCPNDSQVGLIKLHVYKVGKTLYEPIYNLEAPGGDGDTVARLGFWGYAIPVMVDIKLRSESDYGLTVVSEGLYSLAPLVSAETTIWGVPADSSHDTERMTPQEVIGSAPETSPARPSGFGEYAFMTNPTSCSGPLQVNFAIDSYQAPEVVRTATAPLPAISNCDVLEFPSTFDFAPTTREADSPSGLDADLSIDQTNIKSPKNLAPANLRRATVTLPDGMSLNPAAADGLQGCSESQIGLLSENPPRFDKTVPTCPDGAKVGTAEIETPVLNEPLKGSLYVATPYGNPFHTFLSGYLYAQGQGVTLKLPGRFDLDQASGRITATFDENPQQPFSHLRLHFNGGSRGVLVTPPQCGTYSIDSALSPWSASDPANPSPGETAFDSSPFTISSGPNGGPCPNPPAFTPSFEGGTATPLAGAYSPLVVKASRPDGSQILREIDVDLPPGLTAKLAGIPYCSAAALAAAQGRAGSAEQASPSCSSASRVGSVDVGAGAGSTPFHVKGTVYLAGPYKGAPLSLAVITPAVAGPFDLGTVVVRAALQVNPVTAEVHAVSDRLPTILQGVPLRIRSVTVNADRPKFALNPTSCDPMSLTSNLLGSPDSKTLRNRFQVGGCKGLSFAPKLSLKLRGGTKRKGYPALRATLKAKQGEANIKRVSVGLPHSEFLAQEHIRTICTRVQFAADNCPKGSIYGYARAFTPLLDQPLEGPVYLRSSDNPLPDLVASLHGQIDIDLIGRIDSVNEGIRTTFTMVPDAPVSKFVLNMKGGKKGLLVNSRDICATKNKATTKMIAHNGKVQLSKPALRSSRCKKK